MSCKMKLSLKGFNFRLYCALLVLGFVPTVYTTLRIFLIGQLPDEWSYSIAGQLSWVNLFYEILNEAIILPLFFFIGRVKDDKKEFSNRIKTGMLVSCGIYAVVSLLIFILVRPLLSLMATDFSIMEESVKYIRIESVANIFSILTQFALVVLVTVNKSRYLYILTAARLLLCIILDVFFVSGLPFSLNAGVNGIGFSDIAVNVVLLIISVYLLIKEDVFSKTRLDFLWLKKFVKIGGISGLESLVRNVAYIVMISRMVNIVGEQGTYWIANNFIWGWLLLPVLQLGELIKQEAATEKEKIYQKSKGYFIVTAIISALWFTSIPLWKPFMTHILNYDDAEKLFRLVLILIGFYVLYAFQNVFDSIFYGLGKTKYLLLESLVTNTVYYGTAFLLYITSLWTPSLTGIALMFGIGTAFDSIVSFLVYLWFLKKEKAK